MSGCETPPKVCRRLRWWPLLMSSRRGSRWRPARDRRHTAESSTVSGRSCRRRASGHFGRAQEVDTHRSTPQHTRIPQSNKWFHDLEMRLALAPIISPQRNIKYHIVIFNLSSISSRLPVLATVWCNPADLRAAPEMVLRWLWRTVSALICWVDPCVTQVYASLMDRC